MSTENFTCIDSGSEYCPCYLAETNDCLVCTHLQGKGFCDCSWSGVCIYQDFYWCGEKKKSYRAECEGLILEKELISDKGIVYKIKVSKTLARQLKNPGSYIFMRDPEKPTSFNVPMSIMSADEYKGEIEVAVEFVGVKTKSLLDCGETISVKGPFWNGVLGLKELKKTSKENVLIVSRGIAIAPTLLVIKYLLKNNNKVTFLVDSGKLGEIFILDRLKDLDINLLEFNLRTEGGLDKLKSYIHSNEFSLIFSGGADKLHRIILDELDTFKNDIKYAATNNNSICCGEGICGSCVTKTIDGKKVKMCKCQLDTSESLGGWRNNG